MSATPPGILTNQTGYITSRYYDLNRLDFTTNWFQCYDIALTNGLNTVTLHATDLAGNVTTTNFSFTLDYSGDTTPPALTVIWPQDGTAIGGSSFTLQAQVDDNTATVTAQIVDANGDTNTVQGLVERSGLVWIQNLPLGDGENALTVMATDAAGNTTTTNFNVVQNDVGLTMNPLSGGQLNQNTVNVTGTIGNINYVVTVNGVQANVNADGIWEADGVPVSSIGTAVLDVEVYSGMTSNSSMRPMDANSDNSVASDVHEQPQPPLAIASGCGAVGNCEWTNANTWGQSNGVMDETIDWDFTWGGTYDYSGSFADGGPSVWGSAFLFNGGPVEASWFAPAYEYSALNDLHYRRMVQTKVMIVPQGMVQLATTPATQSYLVCACAAEVSPPFLPFDEQNLNSTGGYNYDWMFDLCGLCVGNVPLPLQWLQVQGQTLTPTTNTDGSVWGITVVSAPAGATVDVTPTLVPGVTLTNNDYTFNVQAGGMQIVDVNTGTILTGQTNTVIVGQQVNLKCQLMVSNEVITVFPLANFQWTVPGYAILNYVVAADSSSAMVVTNFPLNNSNVVFYWVDGANNRIIQCSAMAQGKTFTAQAMFNVYRPQLIQFNPMPPYTPVINNGWLELGNDQTYVGTMNFNAIVQSKTDYPQGVVNWTQLVNRNVTGISLATSTSGQYWLDTSRLYNTDTNNNPVNTSIDPRNGIIFYDNPGVGSIGGYLSITDSFQTYLVFNPDPNNASSIWVTLGVVNWGWSATESSWSLTSSNVVAPTYTNSVSLPTWAHILQGKGQ